MAADLETTIKVLLAIAASIAAIGGAIGFIEHVVDRVSIKHNKVAAKVEDHEKVIEKHSEYLDRDNNRLKEMEESNRLIMRGMLGIMTHEIDGNHTEQLKQTRDEIQEYLINR